MNHLSHPSCKQFKSRECPAVSIKAFRVALNCALKSEVLYMSFDRFLLAVESRDLSQADKSNIRVSSFSILQNFDF